MNYSDYVDILRSIQEERDSLIEDLESQDKTIEQLEYEILEADMNFALSQMDF